MIFSFEAALKHLSVHRVGNRLQDEYFVLSEDQLNIEDQGQKNLLMNYFLSSFEKVNEIFHFYHPSGDLMLNDIFALAKGVFSGNNTFHPSSCSIARHLYTVTNHPKIKSGELYVAYFENIQIEGELVDAVGIFKSETKETFFKVQPEQAGFNLEFESDGVNINKLDKGCLIFNSEEANGYKVAVVDNTNKAGDAVYWKDDFLRLVCRNDSYNQTSTVLEVCKSFILDKLDEEYDISKTSKIDLLNRSVKYFKEKESFDIEEFTAEVIGNEAAVKTFKEYKDFYEVNFDTTIPDSFEISGAAVKKKARAFKSIIKLDKNFHIYIHGNNDLIEKGFDEGKNMNYYKVYFKEEV